MIHWHKKHFSDLTKEELYEILKFRMEIFILEQKSFYLDIDNEDQHATHFLGTSENKLIAYARVSTRDAIADIRRVCVEKNFRNQSLGSTLMSMMLEHIHTLNVQTIALDAQHHLQKFYGKYGFQTVGEPYDDGGILHIIMQKQI